MSYEDCDGKPDPAYYVIIVLTGLVVLLAIGLIVFGIFVIYT